MKPDRFRRLTEIVANAASLLASERAAFLDEACEGDYELRREAESILAYEDNIPEILTPGVMISPDQPDSLAGNEISHYRIIERIGEGGMGVVYKADDIKLRRTVALKFLSRDLVRTGEMRARFIKEAQTAAALNSPNICSVYEIDEHEGRLFMVMAFIEGHSLKDMILAGTLDVERVVDIVHQTAEGLQTAHEKGIVHRDIKPSNIMVTPSGGAIILDFGLARSGEQSDLTKTGTVMGTVSYMSPEQARGIHVDHRTDIWSLGAVLHEALTGERPFKGANSESVLYSIINDEPAQISSIRTDLSEELSIIVANALEKDPDNRYQSAAELSGDLVAVGERLGGAERSPTFINIPQRRRAKEASQMRRRVVAAVRHWWAMMLLATAVAAAAVVGAKQIIKELCKTPLRHDRVAVVVFENRTGDRSLDHIGSLAGEWMLEGVSEIELGEILPTVFTAGSSGIKDKTGAGLIISGSYHALGDSIQFRANLIQMPNEEIISTVTSELTACDASFGEIEEFRQRMMGGLAVCLSPEIMLDTYLSPPLYEAFREDCVGRSLSHKDYAAARDHHARAIRVDSTFVEPYLSLASAYYDMNDHVKGEEVLHRLEPRRAKLTEMQRLCLDFMLAEFHGRRREGWRYLMEAARIAPKSDLVKYHMIWVAPEMRRPQMAIELCEEMGGPDKFMRHGLMGYFWYANYTDALHQVGEYERELDVIREARERFPDVVHPWLVEARALAAMGRIEEVNHLIQECPSTEPTWWFTVGRLLTGVAREFRAHGYKEAARDIANRAVEWSQKLQFELYPGEDARSYVGSSLYVAERWKEAQKVYEELARENPESVFYLGATGRVAARLGDRQEALRIFEELQAIDRPYIFGAHNYASAQIASILGDYEQAVVLLSKAFDQTYEYSAPVLNDPDLLLMQGYPAWEELIRPKG